MMDGKYKNILSMLGLTFFLFLLNTFARVWIEKSEKRKSVAIPLASGTILLEDFFSLSSRSRSKSGQQQALFSLLALLDPRTRHNQSKMAANRQLAAVSPPLSLNPFLPLHSTSLIPFLSLITTPLLCSSSLLPPLPPPFRVVLPR